MNLSIKNVPEDIYQHVKQEAAEQGRSLNAQIEYILRRALQEAGRFPRSASPLPVEPASPPSNS